MSSKTCSLSLRGAAGLSHDIKSSLLQERRVFFSEEKKQKTFISYVLPLPCVSMPHYDFKRLSW
jgi:hypothetical protein